MLMRALTILLTNAAYLFVLSTLNSELAPSAYLVLPALFIIPAALYLDFLPMLAVVGVSAFLCSSTTGVRAGLTAALWLSAAFAVHGMRFRFRSGDWFSITALVEITNIILVFFYALFFPRDVGGFFEYASRVSADALLSAAVLLFAGKFCAVLPVSLANFWGIEMSIDGED